MKKKINVLIYLIIFMFSINVYANSITQYEVSSYSAYTNKYKEWLKLDDEQKEKVPEPSAYNIRYRVDKRVYKNSLSGLRDSVTIPSKYDLRDVTYTSPIKDQYDTNLCWAFSATSAFETNYYIQNNVEKIYEPLHISNALEYNFSDRVNPYGYHEINTGGNFYEAVDYWISGIGPVANFSGNGKDRLTASETLDNEVDVTLNTYYELPYFDLSEEDIADLPSFINLIKRNIMEHGEIVTATAAPQTDAAYYNSTYFSAYTDNYNDYYNNAHAMTIIGWDDSFPKENFNPGTTSGEKPSIDGAWLVRNSWGDDYCDDLNDTLASLKSYLERNNNRTYTMEEVREILVDEYDYTIDDENQLACYDNNHGIVYYSYQDYNINQSLDVIIDTSTIDYDYLYQYTPTGKNYIYTSGKGGVIVFDKSRENELLTEVGIDLAVTNNSEPVGYKIYVNPNNDDLSDDSFMLVQENDNAFEYYGYYTIKLDEPVLLTGEKYAIKVVLTNGNIYSHKNSNTSISKKSIQGVIAGQSYYIKYDNTLYDAALSNASLTIKGRTKKITPSDEIAVNTALVYQSGFSMKKNEEINLKSITSNIHNGEVLTYKVFNSTDDEVTSEFTLTDSIIVSNLVISNLKVKQNLEVDNYKIKTYYQNNQVDEDNIYLKQEILASDIVTTSTEALNNLLYSGHQGNIAFTVSTALINLDNLSIQILDSNSEDKTSLFTIETMKVNNQLSVSIDVSSLIPNDDYVINIIDGADSITKEVEFTILEFVGISSVVVKYNEQSLDNIILLNNDSLVITTSVIPTNATIGEINLSIEDDTIASIDNNTISSLKVGNTNLVINGYNYERKIPITVLAVPSITYGDLTEESTIGNLHIDAHYGGVFKKSITLNNYDSNYMNINFDNNSNKFNISLADSNSVINVNYNNGLESGNYNINNQIAVNDTKATTINSSFEITILDYVPVTSINMQDELGFEVGNYTKDNLNISIEPSNSTYNKYRCESLDESVVTTDQDCNINVLKRGNAYIKVISLDNEEIYKQVKIVVEYVDFDENLIVENDNIKKIEYNGLLLGFADLENIIKTNKVMNVYYNSTKETLIAAGENLKTGMYVTIGNLGYNIIIQGDINGDGEVSLKDLAQLRKHLAEVVGSIKTGPFLEACDMNYDGAVGLKDLTRLRGKLAGDN